jgi:hypothetical protein
MRSLKTSSTVTRSERESAGHPTPPVAIVWEKVGNEWKNTSDIWNMDK